MEVQRGKGGIYPVALWFVMVMLLINAYCCAGAAVVVESNTTTVWYNNGRVEESLIEFDLELEYLMNPYVSRMLKPQESHPGPRAVKNRNKPACQNSACSTVCKKRSTYDKSCKKP